MSIVLSTRDFGMCCRVCLKKVPTLRPLHGSSLDFMLSSFISVKVAADDGYPQNICVQCITRLSSAFSFKQTALKSHNTLKNIISNVQEKHSSDESIAVNSDNNNRDNLPPAFNDDLDCTELGSEYCHTKDAKLTNYFNTETNVDTGDTAALNTSTCLRTLLDVCSQSDLELEVMDPPPPPPAPRPPGPAADSENPYLCSYCGNRYKLRTSLARHVRVHARAAAACGTCGRVCASRDALESHLVTHTGERPHRCGACGRGFTQRGSLARHARARHS